MRWKGEATARLVLVVALVPGCRSNRVAAAAEPAVPAVAVALVSDEADAVVAILRKRLTHSPIADADWARLWRSSGYRDLQRREAAMRRAFTDSAFRDFVMSDSLLARATALDSTLARMKRVDPASAATRALRYLPSGARIRAVLYPEIKPRTNSFVFQLDSLPGIFMYVDPSQTAGQLENTLTHELHHIGYASVCGGTDSTLAEPVRTLVVRLGAFGEGLAMLAAAGGADVHPHAVSDSAQRAQWDSDVANFVTNFHAIEKFAIDVVQRRIATPDSVVQVAMTFYGAQGPWYTVGWKMAATIERAFGRERLIENMCDPRVLMKTYNDAVRARGERLPLWSEVMLSELANSSR
jgi:hypothetical protein